MTNKNVNIIASVVLPIVLIMITIALFIIFKPKETTSLFWINLFFAVFLEVVFFCFLNLLQIKTKDLSTPFFAIFGIYCLYYIILVFSGMLVYSLILTHFTDSHKIYIAVLLALTFLWIVVSVLTAQTNND